MTHESEPMTASAAPQTREERDVARRLKNREKALAAIEVSGTRGTHLLTLWYGVGTAMRTPKELDDLLVILLDEGLVVELRSDWYVSRAAAQEIDTLRERQGTLRAHNRAALLQSIRFNSSRHSESNHMALWYQVVGDTMRHPRELDELLAEVIAEGLVVEVRPRRYLTTEAARHASECQAGTEGTDS